MPVKIDAAVHALKKKRKEAKPIQESDFLSSGSTELNLACSGREDGAFIKGHYYLFVGESSSGKTFLTLTALAEAAINPEFDKHKLIHDDIESGNLFTITKFWPALANRISPPRGTRKKPIFSSSIEDLYDNILHNLDQGPVVYIVDSMDALTSSAEDEKDEKARATREKRRQGEGAAKEAGSYGMAKQKENSRMLRKICTRLKKSGSILIIICQTRDAIGSFGWGETKTRGGGHALKFYATLELWSSVRQQIKKKVNGKDREQGVISLVKIKKNRIQGKNRKVLVPIYHSHGIDDTGGMVDYLVEEGYWKKSGGKINAKDFDFKGDRETVVHHIEDNDDVRELQLLVRSVWDSIEDKCKIVRKNKYER